MPREARPQPTRWRPPLPRNPPACPTRRAPATCAATPTRGRARPARRPGPTAFTRRCQRRPWHRGNAAMRQCGQGAGSIASKQRLNPEAHRSPSKTCCASRGAPALNPCLHACQPDQNARLAASAPRLPIRANPPSPADASPNPAVPFKPFRIDPLNREPATAVASPRIPPANRAPAAPFKPSRTDPLNREPGAFPDPDPRPVHRLHEPAPRIYAMRRTRGPSAAGKKSSPKKSLPRMNADKLVSRLRDWLNARVSHRHICVHLRLFAAKILLDHPAPAKCTPRRSRPCAPAPAGKTRPNHAIQTIPY
jgi:hypothetical protein